jgi:hypothetical protein
LLEKASPLPYWNSDPHVSALVAKKGIDPFRDDMEMAWRQTKRGHKCVLRDDKGEYLNIEELRFSHTYFRTSTVPTSASRGEKGKKKTA